MCVCVCPPGDPTNLLAVLVHHCGAAGSRAVSHRRQGRHRRHRKHIASTRGATVTVHLS